MEIILGELLADQAAGRTRLTGGRVPADRAARPEPGRIFSTLPVRAELVEEAWVVVPGAGGLERPVTRCQGPGSQSQSSPPTR